MPTNKDHSVILFDNGQVYSCGKTDNGKLGLGNDVLRFGSVSHLSRIEIPARVISVSAGPKHSVIVTNDGAVWSCGSQFCMRNNGVNPKKTETTFNIPIKLLGNTVPISKCSAGSTFSLALDVYGKVWGCGITDTSAMGLMEQTTELCTLTLVPGLSDIVDIATGNNFSLVLTKSGDLLFSGAITSPAVDISMYDVANTINQSGNFNKVFSECWDIKPRYTKSISSSSNYFGLVCEEGFVWLFGNYSSLIKTTLQCTLTPLVINYHETNGILVDSIYAMECNFIMKDTSVKFYNLDLLGKQWESDVFSDNCNVLSFNESTVFFCKPNVGQYDCSDIVVRGSNFSGECGHIYQSSYSKPVTLDFKIPSIISNSKSAANNTIDLK